jgi:molybdopterin-biosynthesis enzyme MoeA-like protein
MYACCAMLRAQQGPFAGTSCTSQDPDVVFLCGMPLVVQALHCVEVMSLLMRQYLRDKVEASLLHYQDFWQAYAIQQGSRTAYAGVLPASRLV